MSNEEALRLIEDGGLPIKVAVFHRHVAQGLSMTPESAFYDEHSQAHKRAEMLLTPHGLICKGSEGITVVPLANIVYAR